MLRHGVAERRVSTDSSRARCTLVKEKNMRERNALYTPATASPVRRQALRLLKGTATFDDRYVPDHEVLVELLDILREMDCKIAFVTGVWDLWHVGHATYIQKGKEEAARKYPDAEQMLLVVGVDSDEFTRKRKGPHRPIVPEGERCQVLGFQRAVDIITLQTEEDQLFHLVPHDVRIISESTADLPALERIRAKCEHLVNLPPQATTSTTARVRQLQLEGLVRLEAGLEKLLEEVRDGLGK